ncbi:hypothetical protein [Treponema socranskii]|uniref:hypothetical protein n=1 Tax=Treponema socranskii TaxID=53419 RepID=UPI003D6E1BF3
MKKILMIMVLSVSCMFAVRADELGNLIENIGDVFTNISNARNELVPAVGKIPENRELLPFVIDYVNTKNPDLVAGDIKIIRLNVIDNEYIISQYAVVKYMLTYIRQESVIAIKGEGNTLYISTQKIMNYQADKNGNKKDTGTISGNKTLNTMNEMILSEFNKKFSSWTDEEYERKYREAVTDFDVLNAVSHYSPNKLKAKKWFTNHSLDGETISLSFVFADIAESTMDGYAYKLEGFIPGTVSYKELEPVLVYFFSNNDGYIDLQTGTPITVKGKVVKVNYSSDFNAKYQITSIDVFEQ